MAQFKCKHHIYTNNDSGPRSTGNLLGIIIHTTENAGKTTAMDVARYQQNPSAGGSYNMLVDKFRNSVRSNSDNFTPWAAGSWTANSRYIHISVTGQAKTSREGWLSEYLPAIETLAEVVAHTATLYGIPLRKLSVDELRRGVKGVAGHDECSKAFGGSDHWDPGPDFPYDALFELATGTPSQPAEKPVPAVNAIDAAAKDSSWLGARMHEGERPCKDTVGRYADFQRGSIYWHPDIGAIAVPQRVYETWSEHSWEQGSLGYPVLGHAVIPDQGDVQAFQGGIIYRQYGEPGYVVHGVIGDRWFHEGAQDGPLGWPTSDEEDYQGGKIQHFENGSLVWHPSGAVEIRT